MALTYIGQQWSRMLRPTVTAIVLTALSHGVAEAIPITQTFSTSIPGTGSASFDVEFNRFDPTLGTLTSVSGTLSGTFDYSMTIGSPLPIALNIPIGESLGYLDGSAAFGASFAPFTTIVQNTDPFPPDVLTVSGTAVGSVTKSSTLAALLAFYTGTGSVTGVTGSGPITTVLGEWDATGRTLEMTLVYNYTPFDAPPPAPAPEPSTILLLLTGAGLLAARRRKTLVA